MNSIFNETDLEISRGLVTPVTLKKLQDAEDYGTAAPMQWLINRLLILKKIIESNQKLQLFDGEKNIEVCNFVEFNLWCSKVLPTCSHLLEP
jgi:hypothetical protein